MNIDGIEIERIDDMRMIFRISKTLSEQDATRRLQGAFPGLPKEYYETEDAGKGTRRYYKIKK